MGVKPNKTFSFNKAWSEVKVKVTIGCQVYYIKSTLLSASFNPQRGGLGGGNRGREEQHNSIGWSG